VLSMVKKALDRLLESIVVTVVAVLVADVIWQVFTRLVLKNPSQWTEELAVFMLIWVAMLGSAVALERGSHLGIDYFIGKMSARVRLYTEFFVFCAVAAFSFCVMILGGIDLVASTLELDQVSPALGVRVGYVYLAVPISGFFILFYSGIALVERCPELLKGKPTPHDSSGERAGGIA
jgi:TRAP-type C4-dicarboxylate transport system permease small subunit